MSPRFRPFDALRATLAVCLLGLATVAPSAQGLFPDGRALTQGVLDTWGLTEGLPQLSVDALAQTPDGYLWVGTQEGLARFDGVEFEAFDATHGDLPSSSITALHVAADGALWIGTRSGLARYRAGGFQAASRVLDGAYVRSLAEDATGQIWAGTTAGDIARFDGQRFHALAGLDSLIGAPISALAYSDGALWIGTTDRGLWRYAYGRLTRAGEALAGAHVTALLASSNGLWVGTMGHGLARYTNGRLRPVSAFDDTAIRSLHRDASGALWVGAEQGGLVRYVSGRLSTLTDAQGLPHPTVRSLLTDREGSLWIGTEGGGLARLRPGKFVTWGVPEGLGSDIVFSATEARDGSVWFATEGGGISRLREGTVSAVKGLPGDVVLALAPAPGGGVWAGFHGQGLARIQEGRVTHITEAEGLPARSVFALHTDPDGTLWAATSRGLARVAGGDVSVLTEEDGLSNNVITAIARAADGRLLVGTYEGGLNVLDVTGSGPVRSIQTVGTADGLPSEAVISLDVASSGTLWVGTDAGLARIGSGGAVQAYSARDGLPSDLILQPLEDGRGGLWISTNRGLAHVPTAALAAHERGGTLPVTVYAEASGLRTREFNGGVQPAGWRGRDGTLWFASAGGAVAVQPSEIPINTVAPPVHIPIVRADGTAVPLDGAIEIAPGTRRVAIHFTALSFINSPDLPFRYRLSGVDPDWVDAGDMREADYTNLKPGRYTFEVQAANADGVWSETPATLSFEQTPFFTQTFGFKALVLLAGLTLLGLAYMSRIRLLKERQRVLERVVAERTADLRAEKENVEQERHRTEDARNRAESAWARAEGAKDIIEAQASELVQTNDALRDANGQLAETSEVKSHLMRVVAHDLNNPLGIILGYTEVLRDLTTEEAHEYIEIVENAASEMLALVQRFLGAEAIDDGRLALHTRPIDLGALAAASHHRFQPAASIKNQTLAFSSAEGAVVLADRDWIKEVVDNLVSNAVKYTPRDRRIWIDVVRSDAGRVQVRIRDEGPGLTDEDKSKLFGRFQRLSAQPTGNESSTGLGLSIVKRVVELHGGRVWAESVLGEGTTFVAEFDAYTETTAEDPRSPVAA